MIAIINPIRAAQKKILSCSVAIATDLSGDLLTFKTGY